MATIDVDETSAAAPHPAAPGDHVVIRLAESPSSGFRWQLDTYDPRALTFSGDTFEAAADALTGGGGTREFRFVVAGPGHSEVALGLRRAWEKDAATAQRFETAIN